MYGQSQVEATSTLIFFSHHLEILFNFQITYLNGRDPILIDLCHLASTLTFCIGYFWKIKF